MENNNERNIRDYQPDRDGLDEAVRRERDATLREVAVVVIGSAILIAAVIVVPLIRNHAQRKPVPAQALLKKLDKITTPQPNLRKEI